MASAGKNKGEDESAGRDRIVYRATPDSRAETELSTRVLMALDAIPEYDGENGDSVVFEYIDLDALDELFSPVDETARNGRITFEIDRYEVMATAAGAITIKTKPTERN